jgi:hypothetical protein
MQPGYYHQNNTHHFIWLKPVEYSIPIRWLKPAAIKMQTALTKAALQLLNHQLPPASAGG